MKRIKGIEVKEFTDWTTTSPNHHSRKWIEWDWEKIQFIRSLYLNGFSDKDIADQVGCSLKTYLFRVKQQPGIKEVFDAAKEDAISKATKALEKIAEGYYEDELTYGSEIKQSRELDALIKELASLVPPRHQDKIDKYLEKAEELLDEGAIVKKVRKWYPPNKDAINKILDAHRGEIWDAEARRKAIPQVKLNVTLNNKQLRARTRLEPDYEVIS